MEMRKSGKLAIGIIAAMGTIGALHVLVFKDRATEYAQARQQYESINSEYQQQGTSPGLGEIFKFRYDTLRYQLEFWETVSGMRIAFPSYHMPGDDGEVDVASQRQQFWNILEELRERQQAGENGEGPALSFMGERVQARGATLAGWNIRDGLPEESQNIAAEDLLTTLDNEERLLRGIDQDKPVYEERSRYYNNLLAQLGLNVNERDYLVEQFGGTFGTLFTLNRINQVLQSLPENYFQRQGLTEQEALNRMYQLFKITWPKDFNDNTNYLPAERQGEALLEILDVAREEEVADVIRVILHDIQPIYWQEPKSEEEEEEGQEVQGMDDATMMMEFQMGGRGMEGGMGMMGGMMGGRAQMATPTPEREFDSVGAPVEIWVRGSNASTMSFLYRLTHNSSPLELDRLRLINVPEEDDQVIAIAFFNVVTFAQAVGIMTRDDLEEKIIETKSKLQQVAMRPTVRDIAVEDGFLQVEDGDYRVTERLAIPEGAEVDEAEPEQPEETTPEEAIPGMGGMNAPAGRADR